jgi:primary-amine oxidase
MHRGFIGACCALSLWVVATEGARAGAAHPLDALDAEEIQAAVRLLREAGVVDAGTLFSSIGLAEPPKARVKAWTPGEPIPRAAEVVARSAGRTFEGVVDLRSGVVGSWEPVQDAQPPIGVGEFRQVNQLVAAHAEMRRHLARRGLETFEELICVPRSVGNFGAPEENQRRIVKSDCFDLRGVKTSAFATPIEGLFATVDLDAMEIIEITDLGVVPIPPGNHDYDPGSLKTRPPPRPIEIAAPEGANHRVEGSVVRWQNWRFHLRFDARMGTVISDVHVRDGERERSVLYQGSLSEIFVPYQDPTQGWYYRNYMDEGEYGLGALSTELVVGADCPGSALYLSPVLAGETGAPESQKRRVCIFERDPGHPLWRHADFFTGSVESRPAIELVVRFISTVGNYDYLFDWVFTQTGEIRYLVGATGIDSVKGVEARSMSDSSADDDTAYGPLIAPGRVGTNHDHFFSVRLDLDVDGQANNFIQDALEPRREAPGGRRKSIWRVEPRVPSREQEARYRIELARPSLWRVANASSRNVVGNVVSYQIVPGTNALPLVDEDDPPRTRAGFVDYHLWVTRYAPDELYAAGRFPNQSTPGQGLPRWTKQNREIVNQDLVVWYTLGFHHVPSSEDWPVYKTGFHGLTLRPYNFFDRSPAIDVPPRP